LTSGGCHPEESPSEDTLPSVSPSLLNALSLSTLFPASLLAALVRSPFLCGARSSSILRGTSPVPPFPLTQSLETTFIGVLSRSWTPEQIFLSRLPLLFQDLPSSAAFFIRRPLHSSDFPIDPWGELPPSMFSYVPRQHEGASLSDFSFFSFLTSRFSQFFRDSALKILMRISKPLPFSC